MRYEVVREVRRKARISIGIPTYNGSTRISWLIQSMINVGGLPNDAVVTLIDDGSPREGESYILNQISMNYGYNLLRHSHNEGVTKSWNDLVQYIDSEFCILLNDDLILRPRWLDNLIYFLDNNDCGTASPYLFFCTKDDIPDLLAGNTVYPREPFTKVPTPELAVLDPYAPPNPCMAALGCAFGFRRSIYNAVGGFDERVRNTHNESWFGTSLAASLRLPSFILPDRVWHLWGVTFQENPELHCNGDKEAYISAWGGHFDVTHPRYMSGIPSRLVKWINILGEPLEREIEIR